MRATTNWRAVCGKTARTVRREGSRNSMRLPYPYSAAVALRLRTPHNVVLKKDWKLLIVAQPRRCQPGAVGHPRRARRATLSQLPRLHGAARTALGPDRAASRDDEMVSKTGSEFSVVSFVLRHSPLHRPRLVGTLVERDKFRCGNR